MAGTSGTNQPVAFDVNYRVPPAAQAQLNNAKKELDTIRLKGEAASRSIALARRREAESAFGIKERKFEAGPLELGQSGLGLESRALFRGAGRIAPAIIGLNIAGGFFKTLGGARDSLARGESVAEATLGKAAGVTINTVFQLTGFRSAFTGLQGLLTGRTQRDVEQEFDSTLQRALLEFRPTIKAKIERAVEEEVQNSEKRIRGDILNKNAAMIYQWNLSAKERTHYLRADERRVREVKLTEAERVKIRNEKFASWGEGE